MAFPFFQKVQKKSKKKKKNSKQRRRKTQKKNETLTFAHLNWLINFKPSESWFLVFLVFILFLSYYCIFCDHFCISLRDPSFLNLHCIVCLRWPTRIIEEITSPFYHRLERPIVPAWRLELMTETAVGPRLGVHSL